MGYSGLLEEKQKAQELRKKGLSYGQILQQVKVSKNSISRWCQNILLTEEQKKELVGRKLYGQKKGSIIAAENKRNRRLGLEKEYYERSKKEIGDLSRREYLIAGIALYTGEGDKGRYKSAFTNSDAKLIKFMVGWFTEFCKVPQEKFRGAIWIHENNDEQEAKRYWSRLTGISEDKFHKTYIAKNKTDSKKIRKNIHKYGVFSIRFSDTKIQRQILGWILALFDAKIPISSLKI